MVPRWPPICAAYGWRAGSATLPPTLVYVFVRRPKVLQVGGMSGGRGQYIASFCGTGTGWGIRL